MNYDEAREIPGKGWHWTTKNAGEIRTAWPCIRRKDDAPALTFPLPPYDEAEWERCGPHPTREHAERHFYTASLERAWKEGEHDVGWTSCRSPGCNSPANKALGTDDLGSAMSLKPLCDTHRTYDVFVALSPFRPGVQIIHS